MGKKIFLILVLILTMLMSVGSVYGAYYCGATDFTTGCAGKSIEDCQKSCDPGSGNKCTFVIDAQHPTGACVAGITQCSPDECLDCAAYCIKYRERDNGDCFIQEDCAIASGEPIWLGTGYGCSVGCCCFNTGAEGPCGPTGQTGPCAIPEFSSPLAVIGLFIIGGAVWLIRRKKK